MNNGIMSSTTEISDWENTIIPQSRRPSTNSQGSGRPGKKSRPTPQPILPRTNGPGQSVFSASAPIQYVPPFAFHPIPFHQPQTQSVNHFPLPFHQPQYQNVNPIPLGAPPYNNSVNPGPLIAPPSYNLPVNPAFTRVSNEHVPSQNTNSTPPTWIPPPQSTTTQMDTPPQSTTTQMDTPPQYATPPSKSIRGVKSGARRARGGRTPGVKVEPRDNGVTPMVTSTPVEGRGSGRGRARGARTNRGGRPRGSRAGGSSSRAAKRKRDEEDEKDDSDVSEIITPLPTQSRSGRKITHANNFSPIVIDLEEKPKASARAKTPKATINIVETPEPPNRKRKKRASKPGEASVCKNCGRGHSPASNVIVFCDGCNGAWHQFCHDPPISQDVVNIEEQEWFCADCQILREEKAHVEGKVSAPTLSIVEVSLHSLSYVCSLLKALR